MPRLYRDLLWLWPFVSPPESYSEEVESFRRCFQGQGVADGATVLHLGSGGGSIDFHLKRYYRVSGVDLSPEMVGYASRLNAEVEYVVGDIRNVRLGRLFEAVLVHDAIAYMTSIQELEAVYATAAAHLRAGGVMVAFLETLRDRFVQHGTQVKTTYLEGRSVTVVESDYDSDPTDHSFEKSFVFLIHERGELRIEVDRHAIGIFDREEFIEAIRGAGFEVGSSQGRSSELPGDPEDPLITAVIRQ